MNTEAQKGDADHILPKKFKFNIIAAQLQNEALQETIVG